MIMIYEKLLELFPNFDKRKITWRMIATACRKLGALLFCKPMRLDGYFIPESLSKSGKPEIYVNSNLSEDLQIATSVHEIKHAALDYPLEQILFSFRNEWTQAARRETEEYKKYEFEACAMGAIALLPLSKLKHASLGLFDVDDEFLTDIWKIRLHIREAYGI